MTKKELIEQAALKAYPENKDYSTVIEKVVDYNLVYREPYQAGLEKGWQMAVDKACVWLNSNISLDDDEECNLEWFVPFDDSEEMIKDFRKAME